MKTLITYESWGKKYTSQERLNELSIEGKVIKHITGQKVDNGFVYGHYYSFSTTDGKYIASFYKDNGFGFSSQATGIELTQVTTV
jgi:hypothetical protein